MMISKGGGNERRNDKDKYEAWGMNVEGISISDVSPTTPSVSSLETGRGAGTFSVHCQQSGSSGIITHNNSLSTPSLYSPHLLRKPTFPSPNKHNLPQRPTLLIRGIRTGIPIPPDFNQLSLHHVIECRPKGRGTGTERIVRGGDNDVCGVVTEDGRGRLWGGAWGTGGGGL